jgi:hypothetical protein
MPKAHWEFSDLIEKNRTLISRFEEPLLLAVSTCEGTFDITEQLGFANNSSRN